MKSVSSRRRGKARLALALIALVLSVSLGGQVMAEAKNSKPEKAPKVSQPENAGAKGNKPESAAPTEQVSEKAPEAGTPSKAAKDKPSKAGKNKPSKAAKDKPSKKPGKNDPVAEPEPEPTTPPAAKPSTESPAQQTPAAPSPANPTPPATTRRPATRRVGSQGGGRSSAPGRARGDAPTATQPTSSGSVAGTGAGGETSEPASTSADDQEPAGEKPEEASADESEGEDEDSGEGSPVTKTVEQIVEVVPDSVKRVLGGLLALSLVLAGASLLSTARARRLVRQRSELLQEVGLLQSALLPPVPERVGALRTSVAYRPAEGPGAGGDFYDALPLPGGRAGFILGDVSGHGRAALGRTAFLRYTLRAYLEAGLEPRIALQVGGRVIDEQLDGDFATVVLAVHDPATASLTFACAGHPAPIVVGPSRFEPVLPASSPPLGIGLRTGLRQTTIPLAPGSLVCLFSDGLTEARTEGGILGRPRLGDIVADLERAAVASDLLEAVASEARLVTDDMAAVLLSPTAGITSGGFRTEQLEVSADELAGNTTRRFLEACGLGGEEAARTELEAAELARRFGGAVLNVSYGNRKPLVEVLPRNVESIEASSRRGFGAR